MSQESAQPEKPQFMGAYAKQLQFATVFVGISFLCAIAYFSGGLFIAVAFGAASVIFYAARAVISRIASRSVSQPDEDRRDS